MAENIKYQINGQLADNTVTVDNKEDMILVPVNIGSANAHHRRDESRRLRLARGNHQARVRVGKTCNQTPAHEWLQCEYRALLRQCQLSWYR